MDNPNMPTMPKKGKSGNYLIPIVVVFFSILAFLVVMNFAITAPEQEKTNTNKTNTTNSAVNTNTTTNSNTNS